MKIISDSVTRAVGRKILEVKKQSPHIFFGAGVVGVVGAGVLACKATLKLETKFDKIKNEVEDVKGLHDSPRAEVNGYTDQDYYRDLGIVYLRGAVDLGRLYGPAIAVGAVSIAALTGSHIQLTRRNTALTVTLAAVSKAYEEYRNLVREELGAEKELEFFRGIRKEVIEVDGKEVLVDAQTQGVISPYARYFTSDCPNWVPDQEINRLFLISQEEYANYRLQARGHLFLNEIYDALGMEHSSPGSVVGWLWQGEGDNYVSFGLHEATDHWYRHDPERAFLLDFNVDGVIYDKI